MMPETSDTTPVKEFVALVSPLQYAGMRTMIVHITPPVHEAANELLDFMQQNRAYISSHDAREGRLGAVAQQDEKRIQKEIDIKRTQLLERIRQDNADFANVSDSDTGWCKVTKRIDYALCRTKNHNEIIDAVLVYVAKTRTPQEDTKLIELIRKRQELQGKLSSLIRRSDESDLEL